MSTAGTKRAVRLDVWLVDHGLAESREKAQALVMAGRVRLDGTPAAKPGTSVRPASAVEVLPGRGRVGRGGLKLEGALDAFGIDPAGRVAVDVGAGTGGFTEVLLTRGATRVYAVDVGRGQLHERLRAEPRVVEVERVNARRLSSAEVPELCVLATVDVSFISVLKVLPALRGRLAPGADAVVLVKPQFEVGRGRVGRGGIVREPALHRETLLTAAEGVLAIGYAVLGVSPSAIPGAEGNREFFLHLRCGGPSLAAGVLAARIDEAVSR